MTLKAQKLKGFRDVLPTLEKQRLNLIRDFYALSEQFGFDPISTPHLEYLSTLLQTEEAGDIGKELYRFDDHGGRHVGLRFDLTMPFARFVAENYSDLPMPFKRSQVGTLWRGEKPQKGRYREFMQADLDIVGSNAIESDIDLVSSISYILSQLAQCPIEIKLNNRNLLSQIIYYFFGESISIDVEQSVLIVLDKFDKIGAEKTKDMLSKISTPKPGAESLIKFIEQSRSIQNLAELSDLIPNEGYKSELEKMGQMIQTLEKTCSSDMTIDFILDVSLARGLAYYTGVVFESSLADQPEGFGSVASGGRYDDLIARYGKQDISGVGGSIGIDRLLAALESRSGSSHRDEQNNGLYIGIGHESNWKHAFEICTLIRSKGIRCEVHYKAQKVAAQIKYALRKEHSHFVLIGETEIESSSYRLKDLDKGVQGEALSVDQMIHELRGCLKVT